MFGDDILKSKANKKYANAFEDISNDNINQGVRSTHLIDLVGFGSVEIKI